MLELLQDLLRDHLGDSPAFKTHCLHHDPETDVYVLVHAREKAGGASPHDLVDMLRRGGALFYAAAPSQLYAESHRLAAEMNGHFMDQFTHAERATDWRGNNNIAESIFEQLSLEPHPVPAWVVVALYLVQTAKLDPLHAAVLLFLLHRRRQ